ncbi:MAG TPA: potassium channel family protein [Steroidobacteraceae bacterium]|nr:potassium channel family protein [Steroidobacteraceae bacterium]
MYSHWSMNLLVVLATAVTVALAVLLHYEGLRWLSSRLPIMPGIRHRKVLVGVYAVILLHVAEIWMFGVCFWVVLQLPDSGAIAGAHPAGLLDAVYLSATTFSTLGFGDLAPVGPVRFITGTEAVSGFILITWSASFLFLEMQQHWRQRTSDPR